MKRNKLFFAAAVCTLLLRAAVQGQTPETDVHPKGVILDTAKAKPDPTGGYISPNHNGRILHQKAIGMGPEADDSLPPNNKINTQFRNNNSTLKKSKKSSTAYPDTLSPRK